MSSVAQQKDHTNIGFVDTGYDLVSYFHEEPAKGKKKFSIQYKGRYYKFSNEKNLKRFESDPEQFMPQYGGWCAYAMGAAGTKAGVNPKTYELKEGKLYLFYNLLGANTLEKWMNEDPENLRKKADINWERLNK
jgi:YHS domain-containing protein